MPLYHVSYDLSGSFRDYGPIVEAIKSSMDWLHILGSSWVVWTHESVDDLSSRLSGALWLQDSLFVSEVSSRPNGRLKPNEWAWINERINREAAIRFASSLGRGRFPLLGLG